jgi:hypothetical protein
VWDEDAVKKRAHHEALSIEQWLAAYAAALQVVTSYSTIDRQPLDRDLVENELATLARQFWAV